jgi:acetamidase/formamidase
VARHSFAPSVYHVTIGSHEPVLRIASGDSVATATVDARGRDASDEQVTLRGNPQTGPFFVEGAMPGDTLAVRIDSIRPNRTRAWSSAAVAANVVDPEYVRELPSREPSAEWEVDLERGLATLVSPETSLGRYEVALDPMLGCFGVAPPRGQAISTATSAEHGGNMDYRGFREGVTVHFPVFVEGALFHVGDAHAVQGDGEIAGTGLEISADVALTFDVLSGRTIGWPRGESEADIFAVGNARPLDQALQHATTELLRWLQEDYGLDAVGASTLLGQCVRYDVGNVFDPAYTMVARLPKRFLPG